MSNNLNTFDLMISLLENPKSSNLFGDYEGVLSREDSADLIYGLCASIDEFTKSDDQIGVAILLPRNRYYLASIFAVWASGNYFIPLSLDWPRDYLLSILELASPDLIICQDDDQVPGHCCLSLEHMMSSLQSSEDLGSEKLKHGYPSESIAYVIFTSGSTGEPKGVEISHGAYNTYVNWVREYFREFSKNRAVLITAELTFDITLGDVAFALAFGCELHISPDPRNLFSHVKLIRDRNIDTFYSVPTTIARLFSLAENRDDVDLSGLKLLLSGGDSFSPNLIELVNRFSSNAAFYNVYGPTEMTINCCSIRVDDKLESIRNKGVLPIGLPFKHLDARLLDAETGLCDNTKRGELAIAGPQCMTRYVGDRSRTKKAFTRIGEKKYYKTGDLVEIGDDGLYYILGRIDKLVKIKGYRISTSTIDNLLQEHPRITEARTVSISLNGGGAVLVSFVVSRSVQDDVVTESLLGLCHSQLPWYAVPQKIIAVDRLPLGSSGKYDIKALEVRAKTVIEEKDGCNA